MTISGSAGDLATVLARAGLPADNLPARRAVLTSLRALHRLVLASFAATGGPPVAADLAAWARAHGVDLRQALRELGDTVLVFTDPDATAGTGAVPSPPASRPSGWGIAGGPQAFANCAIDALGIAAMLDRDIAIDSTDPPQRRTGDRNQPGRPMQRRPARATATRPRSWPAASTGSRGTMSHARLPSHERDRLVGELAAAAWEPALFACRT